MKNLTELTKVLDIADKVSKIDTEAEDLKNTIDLHNEYKKLLLSALSEEFNAWYFYTITRPFIIGEHFKDIRNLFEETAKDELEDHAYWLMERLNQLGYDCKELAHPASWANFAEHQYLKPIFNENGNICSKHVLEQAIQSELDAIETYNNLIQFADAVFDSTSNLKLREILADEEEHLSDLRDIYESIK
jgi:ferritin-like protein